MKENSSTSFFKLIKSTQTPSPTEQILSFSYNSIAKKETNEKIKILEAERDRFQLLTNKIRNLLDNTLLTRDINKLDSQKKKDLVSIQIEWETTMLFLSFLETQVKETTTELQKAFRSEENGILNHKYPMIKQIGFQMHLGNEEGFVPEVIPGHLFYLINLFCILSSIAMWAVKVQYNVISLFDSTPQGKDGALKNELKPFLDLLSEMQGQMGTQTKDIKEMKGILADNTKIKSNNQDELATNIIKGFQTFCKANITRIPDWIKAPSVYTIVKMFNNWNRYDKSTRDAQTKMRDYEPYLRYRDILFGSEQFVIKWGEKVFAPSYIKMKIKRKAQSEENRRKKGQKRPDALDRLTIGGKDGEKIIELKFFDENIDVFFDEPE